LRRYIGRYGFSTDHMDPNAPRRRARPPGIALEHVLVVGSSYARGHLKRRLYKAGLKERRCELCGQGEEWCGRTMSLILDHINGVFDDNRLENLRIVCPNCNATLDTHCGRKNRAAPKACARCGKEFAPRKWDQRYCSQYCGTRTRAHVAAKPERRKVERPPYEQLLAELKATNFCAVARKYGVSDNAVRKWVCFYEREQSEGAG
jgi:hypothetical protein